jgi:hypothetical protein
MVIQVRYSSQLAGVRWKNLQSGLTVLSLRHKYKSGILVCPLLKHTSMCTGKGSLAFIHTLHVLWRLGILSILVDTVRKTLQRLHYTVKNQL